MEIDKDIAKLI